MARQIAVPTIIELSTAAGADMPDLAIKITIVTAINVIPDRGDQLVRPTHSETMTPATQIQTVPRIAIDPAKSKFISVDEKNAMTIIAVAPSNTAA